LWKNILARVAKPLEKIRALGKIPGLKNSSRGATVEHVLLVSLLVGMAIYGITTTGQSIMRQLQTLVGVMENVSPEEKELAPQGMWSKMYQEMLAAGLNEKKAQKLADVAITAYDSAIGSEYAAMLYDIEGDAAMENYAMNIAAFEAYKAAYDNYFAEEADVHRLSEAVYKATLDACMGEDITIWGLVMSRGYSAARDTITVAMEVLGRKNGVEIADQFAREYVQLVQDEYIGSGTGYVGYGYVYTKVSNLLAEKDNLNIKDKNLLNMLTSAILNATLAAYPETNGNSPKDRAHDASDARNALAAWAVEQTENTKIDEKQ
jgi:hypothetical protein